MSGVLDMQPVHLVVHDSAGMLGAEYTIKHPEKVRSFHIMDAPLSGSASSTLPMRWLTTTPGAAQIIGNLPASFLKLYLNRCCSHSMSAEDAEVHAFLAVYNNGLASLKARMASVDTSAASTKQVWDNLLNVRSSKPTHLLWAVEGSSREHQQQHMYIRRSSNLLQEHQYGDGVGPWPQEDAPEETAEVLSAFIDTLDPTPLPSSLGDDTPEHVKKQFEEMEKSGETHAGCSGHDHAHAGHSHGGGGHSNGGGGHSHGGGGHSHGGGGQGGGNKQKHTQSHSSHNGQATTTAMGIHISKHK
eukprot:CAMPEP_0198230828 /NCGR_PEP_ID=MMETSP1445-20131203/114878_1 /TAXON_ID=36898 /ORGANISM="Pyramimonas sp., Strain CCMP2087" /LENGTH=300 /DNA_ID=CAMNT_0043911409 /DNA_START=859 /DNA_END=1762 /DNA_ORIENTATION=-